MSSTIGGHARRVSAAAVALLLAASAASCAGDDAEGSEGPPAGRAVGAATTPTDVGPAWSGTTGTEPTTTSTSTTTSTTTTTVPAPVTRPARPAPAANPAGCPSVEILSARGTGESQTSSFGLAGLNGGIARQVAGTATYHVVYPASADFLNSPPVGTRDALAHLRATAGRCPGTRFFLTGYSQGAMVMTGVLQQAGDLAPRIAGGVLYGNPYYKGSSPTAAGPDRAATGIIPGGIPASWGGKVRDYCAQGDTVCGSGANGAIGLTRGISAQHLSYPRSALEAEAVSFAVGRLRR